MPSNHDTPITRAIISVSDKSRLTELGQALAGHGVEILSTGGSAKALAEAGIPVIEVADHTGFPEIMDGRVKTLHPKIHGGILARRDHPEDQAAMAEQGVALGWIGLVDALLDSGTLVPVGPELKRPDWGYWLVPTRSENTATRALNDWLLDNR